MKKTGTNALLLLLFLVFDGILTQFRLQNLYVAVPWTHIMQSWLFLVCLLWAVDTAIQRFSNIEPPHWSMVALAVAAGCTAGNAYIPGPYGAWIGAVVCVVCVLVTNAYTTWGRGAVLVFLWAFASPRGQSLEQVNGAESRPDIVVITIDTIREDAISQSNNRLIPNLTPNIDALAQTGCWTNDASATSPLTGPSHAAMFSGMHPIELGLFRNGGTLPADIPWLPENLHRLGYQTAAFVSSAMLEGDLGYRRGFDVYDDDQAGLAAQLGTSLAPLFPAPRISKNDAFSRFGLKTIERMDMWLRKTDPERPVFVWLHLYDAHQPYVATAESQQFVAAHALVLPDPQSFVQWTEPKVTAKKPTAAQTLFASLHPPTLPELNEDTAMGMSKRYLANVRDLDEIVGAAWNVLNSNRTSQSRVWAVLADHGESLTEHGEFGSHQHNVYEANIRVPYILSSKNCPTGPVSTVRLSSDLIKQAALPIPWTLYAPIEAVVSAGKTAPSHPSTIKASKRDGTRKMVAGWRDGETVFTESYDLVTDRHEQKPIDSTTSTAREFEADIQARIGTNPHTKVEDDSVNEALRALGYIE